MTRVFVSWSHARASWLSWLLALLHFVVTATSSTRSTNITTTTHTHLNHVHVDVSCYHVTVPRDHHVTRIVTTTSQPQIHTDAITDTDTRGMVAVGPPHRS